MPTPANTRRYVVTSPDGQGNKLSSNFDGPRDVTRNVRFPATLGTPPHDKWILFEVRTGRHILRDAIIESGGNSDRTIASVALYLPESALKSRVNVAYAQDDLEAAQAAILEHTVQTGGDISNALNNNSTDMVQKLNDVVSGMNLRGAGARLLEVLKTRMANAVGTSLSTALGGPTTSTLEAYFGARVNPRTENLFKNVEYRVHELTFTLVPRSKAEADQIDQIVSILQFYMLPSYGDTGKSFMIGYPYEFEITMFSQFEDLAKHHVNSIGRSVLTAMSVDNAPNQRVAFVEDDAAGGGLYPVATHITLTFQEVVLQGRDSTEIVRGGVQSLADPRG